MIPHQFRTAFALRVNVRFFYGWVMLGVGALGLFVSGPSQSHTFSVFITPISMDLGLSRTAVSLAYAGATLVASLGLPYMGRLVDRFGFRAVTLWVGVFFGASALAFGYVTNLFLLAIGFAALRFLGQGSLMLNSNGLVAQWFSRKRGLALGLTALGFSLSMAVHPSLAQWLIDHVGWRQAWLWMGIATWVLLLPAVSVLIQNKPEDLGLLPDGRRPKDSAEDDGIGAVGDEQDAADVGLTLKEAMRTSAFWIIATTVGIMSLLVTAMFFHQVSILGSQGLDPQTASKVFAISASAMVVFMPVVGRLLDRFPTQRVFAAALLIISCSLLSLAFVTGIASAVVYGFVFGIANAASHTNITFVWPRFFGRKHLASILGVAQMVTVVGASIGPLPFAIAYDLFGSYTGALIATAALPVFCAVAVLFMREPSLRGPS